MTTADITTPTGDALLAALGQLTIVYEDAGDGDGWIFARILEFPAAFSQGSTMAEAREMVLDAARELLLSYQDDGIAPELHTLIGIEIVRPRGA